MATAQNVFRLAVCLLVLGACAGSTSLEALCSDLDEVTREWFIDPPDPDDPLDPQAYEALDNLVESALNYGDEDVVSDGELLLEIGNGDNLVMPTTTLLVELSINRIEEECGS